MNEQHNEKLNRKRQMLFIIAAVLAVALVVVLLGRLSFHTELERKVLPHTLIGYMDDTVYTGSVTVDADDWPQWCLEYDRLEGAAVQFEPDSAGGRIGIFADLIYYENRYELRSWFSGKLIETASEYYYKPEGPLYPEAVYETDLIPLIPLEELVPQGYDFMAFDGK